MHSIQTMSIKEKQKSPLKQNPTVPTESLSLSPIESSLPLSLTSLSIPSLLLENSEPPSPLRPTLQLECYFVEYDACDGKYHTVKANEHSPATFMRQIVNLILSYSRVHVKATDKPATINNITAPKIMKPIIFPVFDSKKYAFVFETSDLRVTESILETSDRFTVFICDQFLPYTLSEIVKNITKQEFEDRVKNFRDNDEPSTNPLSLADRAPFLRFVNEHLHSSKKFYFSGHKNLASERAQQLQWYLRQVSTYNVLIRMNTLHYQPVLLLTLLIHYAIREYKIILVGYKENRHIMSETAIALRAALTPVQYCYPLVFAAISEGHDDYMDAPVPCLVCYWGEERECGKMRSKYRRLSEEAIMPTILIDLNSLTAFNSVTTEEEARAMLDMNAYVLGRKGDDETAVERANRYIREELMECNRPILEQQSAIFKKSLCYQHYLQSKK